MSCRHAYLPGEWCPACGDVPDIDESGDTPANCPGGGIDDLCTWPDVESCGLCTLGMNPALVDSGKNG